ncbi:MAG TPA: C39 family peptidase, partial [Candidatus Dormibacteraeota bacterium]|nr:C39 family peptidase [Candidatus Dormibacteraeota bacterium]
MFVALIAAGAIAPLHAAAGVVIPHRIVHQVGLDCEAAAAEGLLSTIGSGLTQGQIQAALPVDLRPAEWDAAHRSVVRWGDPWSTFVGSVTGSEPAFTGYGVYAPTLAATVASLGVRVAPQTGVDPWLLYANVSAGRAAVVWVIAGLGTPAPRTWTSWTGQTVVYAVGEHAETLVGIDPAAGTVTLMNPEDGRDEVASMARFEASF